MWDKLGVLNNSYQELSDCLLDLCKYEMIGVTLGGHAIILVKKLLDNTQFMIDNIDDFKKLLL